MKGMTGRRALRLITALVVSVPSASRAGSPGTPVGKWKTVDDVTGRATSIVAIWDQDGKLSGRIEQLIPQPGDEPNPLCTKCHDANKDKPIKGMTIIWGLTRQGSEWKGGRIMDPDSGTIYRCKLTLIDNGAKLDVRGFIGISLLGRTQTWLRAE